jgi:hypothetical protein
MSKVQIMLNCLFDIRGIINFEFVPEGTAVNRAFYVEALEKFTDAMGRRTGELWRGHPLILHHDNAPAYSSLRVSQFYKKRHFCHGSSVLLS